MTLENQKKLYKELDEYILSISEAKSHDYAENENVLSNFKNISAAVKALKIDVNRPVGMALFMVILKVGRVTNLLEKSITPSNESIEDSFVDGINYFKLAYCNYKDEVKD